MRDEVGGEVAVTAKVSLSDGFKGGVTTEAGLEFAQLLEADGNLDALQLSGGSSLMNPMYLFRGEVPLKEFAASMPLPVRLGMKTPIGKSFMKQYPFEEAYFWDKAIRFREALAMPLMLLGGINRVDTMERAMERRLRLRGHGPRGAARARPGQPPRRRPRHRGHLHPLQPLHADHLLRHPLPGRHRRLTVVVTRGFDHSPTIVVNTRVARNPDVTSAGDLRQPFPISRTCSSLGACPR